MNLKILTPEKTVLDEPIDFLSVETVEGSLGILPSHAPLIANLKIAPLHYLKNGETHYTAVMGGFLKVEKNEIIILAEAAEKDKEIDELRAKQAREKAEALLTMREEQADLARAEVALKRALTRLKVVEKIRRVHPT